MILPRFLRSAFEGYEILDFKEFLTDGKIEVNLGRKLKKQWLCHRCGTKLGVQRGKHRLCLEGMPIMGFKLFVHLWRHKGHCGKCNKARSEHIEFVSAERPNLMKDYAWWIGRLCEIAAVSRVAELTEQDEMTTWRLDLHRMKQMAAHYKIPKVKRISVDEVYARKKAKSELESRNERFFTVISDLDTGRVIWVSPSRDKNSLDQFFILLGEEACKEIAVVAADQHDDYAASVRDFCPNAKLVWDRFHIMQNFEIALNDQRIELHGEVGKGSELYRQTRGKFKYLFLKAADRRTDKEKLHINDVVKDNEFFFKLELIKERMLTFFKQPNEAEAKKVFEEVGDWIWQAGFKHLQKWFTNLNGGWATLKNYFSYRVTSALSEGHNNVIKMLKRRAFGYRNMLYFRLKIMQVCGYLNSRYIKPNYQ